MKITKITYGQTFQVKQFEPERLEVEIELNDQADKPEQAFAYARKLLQQCSLKNIQAKEAEAQRLLTPNAPAHPLAWNRRL